MKGKQMEIIGIVLFFVFVMVVVICVLRRRGIYLPKKILGGSARSNELMPEVDKTIGILFSLLEKHYGRMDEAMFGFTGHDGLLWTLWCDPVKKYQFRCGSDDGTIYVFGQGRSKPPPLRMVLSIYRSLPKVVRQVTKTFPKIRGELDLLQEASRL